MELADYFPGKLSEADAAEFRSWNPDSPQTGLPRLLVIVGLVSYEDIIGNGWEMRFCYFYHPGSIVLAGCPTHNSIRRVQTN